MDNLAFDRCVDFMTEMLLKYGGISTSDTSTDKDSKNNSNEDAA